VRSAERPLEVSSGQVAVGALQLEPASFRDPASTVAYLDGRVLRGLTKQGAADFEALAAAPFFERAMAEGRLVRTWQASPEELPQGLGEEGWVGVLEHQRIPLVTYPYEWTFSMLKDAALVHLDLLLEALDAGLTMKDGYAYNLAFSGARPVFIDVGSFEPVRQGEPWAGYRQFCQTMLYPLLLQAHKDVRFQPWLRGQVGGIQPQELVRLFTGRDRLRPGVLKHVVLHGAMDRRHSGSRAQDTQQALKAAGFSTELQRAAVAGIRKLVARLEWRRSASEWKDYQATSSYSQAERELKAAFVERALEGKDARLVFDLGGNDGTYSRVAARHAQLVVCADGDDLVLDGLYRSLQRDGEQRVLPAYLDLADPSPGLGWRGRERPGFFDRAQPDAVLALALLHHLAITGNLPLAQLVDWLHGLGGRLVVEFVDAADPMADRLLANKPPGMHGDYRRELFERLLEARFEVIERQQLPSGTRTLYHATPRR
jgi:hypothetical protein